LNIKRKLATEMSMKERLLTNKFSELRFKPTLLNLSLKKSIKTFSTNITRMSLLNTERRMFMSIIKP